MRIHKKHELFVFMKRLKDEMALEYRRIGERSTEDPGTAGDQAEENWATLLRSWLPASYPIVTKGRIINHESIVSPQIDVLVLHPNYPQFLRDKKLYFSGGVAAAFECKLTLRNEDLKKAFKNAAFIKRMIPQRIGNPYDELHKPLVLGLLAHSHNWKKTSRLSTHTISDRINAYAYDPRYIRHPSDMLDVICVADVATILLHKAVEVGPVIDQERKDLLRQNARAGGIITSYLITGENEDDPYNSDGDLFYKLISHLTSLLAFEDMNLRPFADYLVQTRPLASFGQYIEWEPEVLSREVLHKLERTGCDEAVWSKWQRSYP